MDVLITRYRNFSVLFMVLVGQLVLLAYQVKTNNDIPLIRVWAATAVTPLARVLEWTRRNTIGFVEDYLVLLEVRAQNERLAADNNKLKLDNQFLRNQLEMADRAKALQAFASKTPSRTVAAVVIGSSTNLSANVNLIDRGSMAGVKAGMAVVTPDGIVGKVLRVYPTASQVLLITDPNFRAGVVSGKSRIHGVVKGQGEPRVKVDYIQSEDKVEVGEIFYTSGDDRVFPKGLPVGRATVVRDNGRTKDVLLAPFSTQAGVEEVLVVLDTVHGEIPENDNDAPRQEYYIGPAPAPETKVTAAAPPTGTPAAPGTPAANNGKPTTPPTEADRLLEKYRQFGESVGHVYGETPGRVPNFADIDKPRPKAATPPVLPTGTPVPPARAPGAAGAAKPPTTSTAPANAAVPKTAVPKTAAPRPAAAAGAPAAGVNVPVNRSVTPPATKPATPGQTSTGTAATGTAATGTAATGTAAPRPARTLPVVPAVRRTPADSADGPTRPSVGSVLDPDLKIDNDRKPATPPAKPAAAKPAPRQPTNGAAAPPR